MATKKNTTTGTKIKKTTTKKKVQPAEMKENVVEQKLNAMVDETPAETPLKAQIMGRPQKKQSNFPWWGLVSLVLLLIFATILLYQYNKDFRSNFSNMLNSTGIFKMQNDTSKDPVVAKDAFQMNMTIVYNKDDAHQKETIDQYLQNIEKNLNNTKVNPTWLDKNSTEGKALITKLNSKYLPIFVTDTSIQKHPQYSLFAPALKDVGDSQMQFASEGMEYLTTPPVGDARVIGANPAKAKVVITEYASLTCHYCQGMQPIVDKVVKAHPNDIAWVVKMFDRGNIDSELEQSAECAGDQKRFNQMMDALYAKQADIFTAASSDAKDAENTLYAVIKAAAKDAGANGDKVLACVKAGTYADKVKKSTAEGQDFGVIGTPSFFVNKQFVGGALDEAPFTKMVEDELSK